MSLAGRPHSRAQPAAEEATKMASRASGASCPAGDLEAALPICAARQLPIRKPIIEARPRNPAGAGHWLPAGLLGSKALMPLAVFFFIGTRDKLWPTRRRCLPQHDGLAPFPPSLSAHYSATESETFQRDDSAFTGRRETAPLRAQSTAVIQVLVSLGTRLGWSTFESLTHET